VDEERRTYHIAERFLSEMTGLVFSVAQFSAQAISEIWAMDVKQFYRLLAKLEDQASKSKQQ